jgi:response regulator RpfG family c-di-GMP phosphodiesterase/serine/threonine protein kinase
MNMPVQTTPTNAIHRERSAGVTEIGSSRIFLQQLLDTSVIHPDDWDNLPKDTRDQLFTLGDRDGLLNRLVELSLINTYQVGRINAGTMRSLAFGNYRVLGSMGIGGSSVVFEAEHVLLRRKVAVKVLPVSNKEDPTLVTRFLRELRAVAQLNHPNIVAAFDAGLCPGAHACEPDIYYFAMEHLIGKDLEQEVRGRRLSIGEACALAYQIASALDEAHRHQLVHRDIKPSNVFVTQNRQAKLLDFGLVRHLRSDAFTTPDVVLGTLEYMAPEQASDASQVDVRTDIFGLGATLFFALTGASAFPAEGHLLEAIRRRQKQAPLQARSLRAEIPEALEDLLQQMLALRPADRLPTPEAVMHALLPFLDTRARHVTPRIDLGNADPSQPAEATNSALRPRVLIADANAEVRERLARLLTAKGMNCVETADGASTLQVIRSDLPAVVLLAVHLPGAAGRAVLSAVRENPPCANLKILMTTSAYSADEMAAFLSNGADDYLAVSISNVQMVARVNAALQHKAVQDRTDQMSRQLLELNSELERNLDIGTSDLVQARNALVLALARLVEYRSTETIAHLSRMQRYCAVLAQEAAAFPAFANQISPEWIQTLECCAPLHDIGNVGLPDPVLLKAGRLDENEHRIMQTHTIIGADTLQNVARRFGAEVGFLHMAIDIARHHHEHYDGTGYPDRLAGDNISLSARIVAIADAYDALRSRRSQRPGLSHAVTLQILLEASPGKFDPTLLSAFQRCTTQFERIFRELPDSVQID